MNFEEIIDTYKQQGLRARLVKVVSEKGIKDKAVLEAIGNIKRHEFMDSAFLHRAYHDSPFPIGNNQTISQPYTVAFQTELLKVKANDKILEIGTGSGYQAAVLSEIGAEVHSIERIYDLYISSQKLLRKLGYGINFYYGDGYKGKPEKAPFDGIIITAAAAKIPGELLKQLKIGGRMVIPVGNSLGQKMLLIKKISENKFEKEEKGLFSFVPMLEDVC